MTARSIADQESVRIPDRLATIARCIEHAEQKGAKLTQVLSSRQIRYLYDLALAAQVAEVGPRPDPAPWQDGNEVK